MFLHKIIAGGDSVKGNQMEAFMARTVGIGIQNFGDLIRKGPDRLFASARQIPQLRCCSG